MLPISQRARELHRMDRMVIKNNPSEDLSARCPNQYMYLFLYKLRQLPDVQWKGSAEKAHKCLLENVTHYLKRRHQKANCQLQLNVELCSGHHTTALCSSANSCLYFSAANTLRLVLLNYCFNIYKTVDIPFRSHVVWLDAGKRWNMEYCSS